MQLMLLKHNISGFTAIVGDQPEVYTRCMQAAHEDCSSCESHFAGGSSYWSEDPGYALRILSCGPEFAEGFLLPEPLLIHGGLTILPQMGPYCSLGGF